MSKYDIENLLDDIEAMLRADLNTQIAAVSLEKTNAGKPITLDSVDTTAFYRQTWSDGILLHNPGIFFGIENIEPVSTANFSTLEKIKIFVYAIIIDSGMDTNGTNKLLRYSRAIKEVFQNKFKSVIEAGKLEISNVAPVAFLREMDSSEEVKLGGVTVSTTLDI